MRKTFTLLILLAVGTLGYSQETTVKENRVDNPIRYDQQRKSQTVTQSGVSLQSGEIDAKSQGVNNPTVLTREQVQHQGTYQLPRESTIKGFAEMNPGRVTSNSERQLNVQSRNTDSFHRTVTNLGENNPVIFNRVSTSPTVNYPLNQDDIEAELLADAAYRASNPVVYVSPAVVANRPMADITPTAGATETFTPAVGDNFFDPGGPGGANSDGNAGNYPNCNCDTQTTLAGVSEIEFLDFGVNGTFDYLRIYDGTDATGTILYDNSSTGANTGDKTLANMIASHGSATFTSTSGNFFFFFHASGVVNWLGWDALIVATDGGGGGGDTCSEENPNDGTFENGFNCSSATDFMTANDVTVAAGEDFTLTNITASIFANGGIASVDVNYYDDAAGLPGTLIGSETGVTIDNQTVIGTNFGIDVNEIELSVDPFVFVGQDDVPTTYWIELSVTDGGATGSVFWVVTSSTSVGNKAAQFDAGWSIGDPLMDGVYIFEGTCAPTGGGGGGGTFPEPYCGPLTYNSNVEPITNVEVAGISNRSDAAPGGSPAHEDFTTIIGEMAEGESYPIALEGNTDGNFTASFTVFIDWNQDGILDNAGERYEIGTIVNSNGNDGIQATGTITVPAGVVEGETRMRVIKKFLAGFATDSCTPGSGYGQAEDYTIDVTAGGGGGGDTCFEENPNDGTFENGFNCSSATDFMTANDVTVAAGEDFTLTNITASIFANGGISNVDVNYYSDTAGLPGTLIGSETGVTIDSQTVIGTNFGFDVNEIELSVDPFLFEGQDDAPTTYWVELSVTDGGATGSVFWVVTSSSSVGHPAAQFDAGWAIGDPLMDGVYIFEGECEPTGGGGGGDTCAEENPNDGTFENGFNCSSATDFMTANDVTIPAGEDFTLTNITASIFANGGIASVDVNYYDDAAGLPGALIGSETGVTIDSQAVIGNNFGFDVNEIELSVEPFVFEGQNDAPTTYWIELSVTDGGATGSVFWVVTSSSSVGHPAAQFDAGWTIGDPLMDGVYIFEGECNATVGIEDNSLNGFNFYPNPANQMLYLNASKNIESVELFNMLGQKVMANQIGATSSNLNVEGLAVGTYIMKVTVDGQTGTYKVIKN